MRIAVLPVLLAISFTDPLAAAPAQIDDRLVDTADVIVTGRIASASSHWDTSLDIIYTRLTVDVSRVLKGWVPQQTVSLLQMGGTVGDVGLLVAGQPMLSAGDEVLLFIKARPRDGSWYAAAGFDATSVDTSAIVRRTGGAALVDPATLAPVAVGSAPRAAIPPRCPGALRNAGRATPVLPDQCGELGGAGDVLRGTWFAAQSGHPFGSFVIADAPVDDAPTGVRVRVNVLSLTVLWDAVPGSLGYRVDFRQRGGGPVLATAPAATNSLTVNIPQGASGEFQAEVIAVMPAGESLPSAPAVFTLGHGGTCTEPPDSPTGGEGYVEETEVFRQATAHVWWDPLDEPNSWFHVRAYDLIRGGQIFNQAIGATNRVNSPVGPGFYARVEVYQVNICGESAPLVIFVR